MVAWRMLLVALMTLGVPPADAAGPNAAPLDTDRVEQLIEQLGVSDFHRRESAYVQLASLGFDVLDQLILATTHPDPEVAARSRRLIAELRVDWVRPGDSESVRSTLEGYQNQPLSGRLQIVERLGYRQDPDGVQALCRIARFDPSNVVSKQAALAVLDLPPPGADGSPIDGEGVSGWLGLSIRPAVSWIRVWRLAGQQPQEAAQQLDELTRAERQQLESGGDSTTLELTLGLHQFHERVHREQGHIDQALDVVERMAQIEGPRGEHLARLVRELVDRQDWPRVDAVVAKLPVEALEHADTLYLVAEARLRAGRDDEAQRLAQQALRLDPRDGTAHFRRSFDLAERELFDWSQAEAERVRQIGFGASLSLARDEDPERIFHLLEAYPKGDETERSVLIGRLIASPPDFHRSALQRIVRFEPSERLAQEAAGWLLFLQDPPDDLSWPSLSQKLSRPLVGDTREAARWVVTYATWQDDPQQATADLQRFVDEQTRQLRDPQLAQPLAVAGLLRVQALVLEDLGQDEQLDAVWRAMARLGPVPGARYLVMGLDQPPVFRQADLLWHAGEYRALVALGQRSQIAMEEHPLLKYLVAGAHEALGEFDRAEELAAAALDRFPGERERHQVMGTILWYRGLSEFAEKELRYVIGLDNPGRIPQVDPRTVLAYVLHERGRNREAAELIEAAADSLEELSERIRRSRGNDSDVLLQEIRETRAKQLYYSSLHHGAQGNIKQQREDLLKALDLHADDVDVLIALFRVPKDAETAKRVVAKIRQAQNALIVQAKSRRSESVYPNNLAWLVANTFGDLDLALAESLRSLELRPGSAGHLDTLGRVHFARGELDRALAVQRMAVRLEPFRGPLNKQLELFERERDLRASGMSEVPGHE